MPITAATLAAGLRTALETGIFPAGPTLDYLESLLKRWEIQEDPASAGRAFQRQLAQDYAGTLQRFFRLHEDDQRLLAGAYLAYYAQIGGIHLWNSAEGIRLYWKASAARLDRAAAAAEAQQCAVEA